MKHLGKGVNAMKPSAQNGAEGVLIGLKACGVDYLFANAGTDFPPIIEALASQRLSGHLPVALTIPHHPRHKSEPLPGAPRSTCHCS